MKQSVGMRIFNHGFGVGFQRHKDYPTDIKASDITFHSSIAVRGRQANIDETVEMIEPMFFFLVYE